jgi:superoxide dismutase, Fe-Mn family
MWTFNGMTPASTEAAENASTQPFAEPNAVQTLKDNVLSRRAFLKMGGAGAASLLLGHPLLAAAAGKSTKSEPAHAKPRVNVSATNRQAILNLSPENPIVARSFDQLEVQGLSKNQLKQHIGLYQGYVKKANEIHQLLANASPDVSKVNATYDPFRELLVEESFAMNGIILHELYFDNLGSGTTASSFVQSVFAKHFGTWDGFINQLKAAGKAMRGWAVVAFNIRDNRIHLYGLDTHNQWAPMHTIPLLVLDVYEHAYMIDFGTNRGSYLDVFVNNINWGMVEQRLLTLPIHTA